MTIFITHDEDVTVIKGMQETTNPNNALCGAVLLYLSNKKD